MPQPQYADPTPRNKLLGLLADAVKGGSDFVGTNNPPVQMLMQGLGINDLGTALDKLSYGERLTSGSGQTTRINDEVPGALGALIPGAQAITRIGPKVASAAVDAGAAMARNASIPTDMAMQGQRGAIRIGPKMAQNIADGLYHPIGGGLKLDKPVGAMQSSSIIDPSVDMAPRMSISPEQMQGGAAVPLIGDRAAAGRILTSVGGRDLADPVALQGGPDFMRTHGTGNDGSAAWASDKGIITRLKNQTMRAADHGNGDVYGVYTAMSPTGVDFNTMLSKALVGQMDPQALPGGLVSQFDTVMRANHPDFVGLRDPNLLRQLLQGGAGNMRKDFVNRSALDAFRNGGWPDVAETRAAITEPSLMDSPIGSTGYTMAHLDPDAAPIAFPASPHDTYNTQLAGQYAGSLDKQVPYDVMFPNFFRGRRSIGAAPAADNRAFTMSAPIQPLDQQWLDGVMAHLEASQ